MLKKWINQPVLLSVFLLITLLVTPSTTQAADEPLTIVAPKVVRTGWDVNVNLMPFDHLLRANDDGYTPKIDPELQSGRLGVYERDAPTKVKWGFGDGTTRVNTGDRVNASHRYSQPGKYRISAILLTEDGHPRKTATTEVTVQTRQLSVVFGANVLDANEPTRITFNSLTYSRPLYNGEVLTYYWDFGDGTKEQGENLSEVTHTYALTGKYKPSLMIKSSYGIESRKNSKEIVVVAKGSSSGVGLLSENMQAPETIDNRFTLAVNGSVSGKVDAKASSMVSSMALSGPFLGKKGDGNCQLMFSYWDDSALFGGLMVVNLGDLPGEMSSYNLTGKQRVSLWFHSTNKSMYVKKKTLLPMSGGAKPGSAIHPFGDDAIFSMTSGSFKLTINNGQYVLGEINAGFTGSLENAKPDDPKMHLTARGNLSLDLTHRTVIEAQMWDKIKCQPKPFTVKSYWPDTNTKHFKRDGRTLRVEFTEPVMPQSLTQETAQLGYPDTNGEFVPVSTKIVLHQNKFNLVPTELMKAGVKYRLRLKTGEQGIRATSGHFLEDESGSGWQESNFWTALDFSNKADSPVGLRCDVYQTVKHVPLIRGKPALVKVVADWKVHKDVQLSAQYEDFFATVKLDKSVTHFSGDLAHKFIRPDMRALSGGREAAAELSFSVNAETFPTTEVTIVPQQSAPLHSPDTTYKTTCATKTWQWAPELDIDLFVKQDGRYGIANSVNEPFEIGQGELAQLVEQYSREVERFTLELFPYKSVRISAPKFAEVTLNEKNECLDACWSNLQKQARSNADVILLVASHEDFSGGGTMIKRIDSGQALIWSSLSSSKQYYSRYVSSATHEIGHALSLLHQPYVDLLTRTHLTNYRSLRAKLWYEGIDGVRMSSDGKNWWIKSSTLGNDESEHLVPLMYPATMYQKDVLLTHYAYRIIQAKLESLSTTEKLK